MKEDRVNASPMDQAADAFSVAVIGAETIVVYVSSANTVDGESMDKIDNRIIIFFFM